MITTSQILDYMESGRVFSCKVVAFDKRRGTGGNIKFFPEAKLVQKEVASGAGRPMTEMEKKREVLEQLRRNPNHKKWFTRNIRIMHGNLETMEIKKVHPPLIIEFNGEKVTP